MPQCLLSPGQIGWTRENIIYGLDEELDVLGFESPSSACSHLTQALGDLALPVFSTSALISFCTICRTVYIGTSANTSSDF